MLLILLPTHVLVVRRLRRSRLISPWCTNRAFEDRVAVADLVLYKTDLTDGEIHAVYVSSAVSGVSAPSSHQQQRHSLLILTAKPTRIFTAAPQLRLD